jgi:hypothetical protein
MDHVRRWLPELHLRVYVDDIKGTLFGEQGTRDVSAPRVAAALVQAREAVPVMVPKGSGGVRGGKSRQLASTAGLRKRLRTPLAELGIGVVDAAVYLGTDAPTAGRRSRQKRKQRDKRFAWRIAKLRQVRREGTNMCVGVRRVFMNGSQASGAVWRSLHGPQRHEAAAAEEGYLQNSPRQS